MPLPFLHTASGAYDLPAIMHRAWAKARGRQANLRSFKIASTLRACFAEALREVWDEAKGARVIAAWRAEQDAAHEAAKLLDVRTREIMALHQQRAQAIGIDSTRAYPAIRDAQPASFEGAFRVIRPTPQSIRESYASSVRFWGARAEPKAAERRDRSLAALREREAAAQVERERVNEPAISAAEEAAADAMYAAEDVFLALDPSTPAVAATRVMFRAVVHCEESDTIDGSASMEIAAIALRGFLPMLTGEIAADAAEFVADPERPLSAMRISRGIEA